MKIDICYIFVHLGTLTEYLMELMQIWEGAYVTFVGTICSICSGFTKDTCPYHLRTAVGKREAPENENPD